MRVTFLALAAGAFVFVSGAALADDPMSNTYANTVHTTNKANGAQGTLMFNADNSYMASATDAKGQPISYKGTWMLKDDGKTICLTPNIPNANPPPPTTCSPLEKHNVGETWTVTNNMNETYDVSLTAGR